MLVFNMNSSYIVQDITSGVREYGGVCVCVCGVCGVCVCVFPSNGLSHN
jgi:hypothetical protein